MAEADPLVLAPGNGLERGRNGGSGIRAAIALPALLGKLGKGSGIVLGAGNAFPKTPANLQRPDLAPPGTRTLNLIEIGRHLDRDDIDPPLRAVFIYNHNPIVVHPDQNRMRRGLARDDVFTVGIDVAMTESMAHCDIVLPAASSFECDDLYPAYGHHWLQRAEAGDRAARRIAAEHGDLPPPGRAFRLRRCRASQATDAELMDDAVDPADARLRGVRPSQISTTAGIPHGGAGRRAAGVVRERAAGHAVRKDRAGVGDVWRNAGAPRRASPIGGRRSRHFRCG